MGAASPFRLTLLPLLTLTLLAVGLAPMASAMEDGELLFNQKFRGVISSSIDADLVKISEVEGSKLTITVTRDKGNGLRPMVELLNEAMSPIDVGNKLKLTKTRATIKKFTTLYGGIYYVRVSGRSASTGTYRVKVKGVPADKAVATGSIGIPAEIDEVLFQGRVDSKVKGSIIREAGALVPVALELVAPSGTLVSMAGKTSLSGDLSKLTLDWIKLPELGTYRLRITGQGGSIGDYRSNLRTKLPKPQKGTVWEDEHPGNPGPTGPSFTLQKVFFGRGLRTADGLAMDVVSPFSTVLIDPISSLPLEGTLEALFVGGNLNQLVDFNIGAIYSPPVVPRNGVLVLRFTANPLLASLNLDADRRLTVDSPLTLTVNGQTVPLEVFVDGKDLILNPVLEDNVGFPPSPVALDGGGNPTTNVFGAGKIELLSTGPNLLESTNGGAFKPRGDLIGSSDAGGTFIGFNPGNQILDFFVQSGAGGGVKSFGGFLPDVTAPRLIRELSDSGDFMPDFASPQDGDLQGLTFISVILDRAYDTVSKQGRGEWAGGLLVLRPDTPTEEKHLIASNMLVDLGGGLYRNDINTETSIKAPLATAQEWKLVRAEFFEPDPNNPIDPDVFDPFNPELDDNTELINFVEVLDRNGDPQDVNLPIDPLSTFSFLFNEAMQIDSFRPYESFYVSDNPKVDNPGINRIGMVTAAQSGRKMTFHPDRIIQFGPNAGTRETVGLGNSEASLLFHLQVVPPPDVLQGLLGETGLEEFLKKGYRGVTDVGGQPLGLPPFSLTVENPLADYTFPFAIFDDPALKDWGAVAQRFQGQPKTGFDSLGNAGITYEDVPITMTTPGITGSNIYGPRIADLNLFANGFLSGAPVQFFTKIHDDFNPPPTGEFTPSLFGTSTPIGGWAVLGGAKMQHVFRSVDASPDWVSLAGTKLDLYHMAYAPIGGFVTNTTLPDISIHAGHTSILPDTRQSQGIPTHGSSGLRQKFVNNYDAEEWVSGISHERQIVAGNELLPGVTEGVQFNINNALTYTPIGSQNAFHPLPDKPFDRPFAYNNGVLDTNTFGTSTSNFGGGYGSGPITWPVNAAKTDHRPQSLLIEYRTRVVDVLSPPATQNGFTFSVGILTSALPRFRAFTFGAGCMSCCAPISGGVDCLNSCIIAYGPSYNAPNPGAGGVPLEPDLITDGVGPAPAPPGLACKCIAAAANAPTPPAICTQDNTVYSPTMDQVAYGMGIPTQVNFGDNSRYFMLFNYVKRESFIRSPFIRAQPGSVGSAIYHAPIFVPPLDDLPEGTIFDIRFRSSSTGTDGTTTLWVTPEQMADINNPINLEPTRGPFLQFEVLTEGNTSTFIVPIFDEIIVPLEKGT